MQAPEAVNDPVPSLAPVAGPDDFSVMLGGPLYRLYRRLHLAGESLELGTRREIVVVLFAWLPLLILSMVEGTLLGGVAQPFLLDVDAHARLLIALPLLIDAEARVHARMRGAARQFVERGLAVGPAQLKLDAAAASVRRLRESRIVEAVLLVFVYSVGIAFVWRQVAALDVESWKGGSIGGETTLTLAGWWYVLVSVALFQFILFRWYVRLAIWAWFLWNVSRSGLSLVPTHPDRCGGLGFLSIVCYAFVPLLLAHGALFAGVAAAGIFFDDRMLPEYSLELIVLSAVVLLFVLGPFLVFVPTLIAAKRMGLREYGGLAQRYVRNFEREWLRREEGPSVPPLGSPDIQSLADLDNAYQIVTGMRFVPVTWTLAVRMVIVMLVPLAPLSLTMISDNELASMLVNLLF